MQFPKLPPTILQRGLTFDSVLLPRLTENSFSWIEDSTRTRLFFVDIARATQWVYLSTVKGKEFSEIKVIHDAETNGHLTLQHTYDFKQKVAAEPQGENIEDEFSLL